MAILGHLLIGFSLVLFFYSFIMSFVGAKNDVAFLKKSSLFSYYGGTLLLVSAALILLKALLFDNFAVEYVFLNSARDVHWIYKMAAFYAGREGSLFFWALTLSLTASLFFTVSFKGFSKAGYELTTISTVQVFFGIVLFFVNSPFKALTPVPLDGKGLNPVLENLFMVIHPPFIFLGYMFFTIPFALALASLAKKDRSGDWIKRASSWLLFGFLFLGFGNAFGAYWAYTELGWGGYWSWDPVENSSLMPWLLSIALIHSAITEKRFGMNRIWNYVLVFSIFVSTMLSIFITRSGVVASIHAYGGSSVGWYFLVFIIIAIIICFSLLILRYRSVVSERLGFLTSKEALLRALNICLVVFVLAILAGTFSPLLSKFFLGKEIIAGPSYYNLVLSFLGPLLLFGIGISPLLSYRKPFVFFSKDVLAYLLFVVLGGFVSLFLKPVKPVSIITFSLCFGALFTVLREAFISLKNRTEPKRHFFKVLGGTLAALGVVLMALGIIGSAHKTQVQKDLKTGEKLTCSGFEIVFKGLGSKEDTRKAMVYSLFDMERKGRNVATLKPAKFFFKPTSPGMRPRITAKTDTYTNMMQGLVFVLEDFDLDKGLVNIIVITNPLIFFLWSGLILLFTGGILSIYRKK